jgi:peptidoglycan/LPS O-acetylase OafA/YrhL
MPRAGTSRHAGRVENRETPALGADRPVAAARRQTALLSAAALAGAVAVYALLAVVVLLSAQQAPTWEIWLVAVPAGALVVSVALATAAARRRASTTGRGTSPPVDHPLDARTVDPAG